MPRAILLHLLLPNCSLRENTRRTKLEVKVTWFVFHSNACESAHSLYSPWRNFCLSFHSYKETTNNETSFFFEEKIPAIILVGNFRAIDWAMYRIGNKWSTQSQSLVRSSVQIRFSEARREAGMGVFAKILIQNDDGIINALFVPLDNSEGDNYYPVCRQKTNVHNEIVYRVIPM